MLGLGGMCTGPGAPGHLPQAHPHVLEYLFTMIGFRFTSQTLWQSPWGIYQSF